jgi:hypothetical protein
LDGGDGLAELLRHCEASADEGLGEWGEWFVERDEWTSPGSVDRG